MSDAPYILIGNPDNRRVTMFREALRAAGLPKPFVLSHLDLIHRPELLDERPDEPAVVRLDSAGENWDVEKALLHLGYRDGGVQNLAPDEIDALEYDVGRILSPSQHFAGFRVVLERLKAIYARHPSWTILSPPDSVADVFDKRVTSRRYQDAGIPVPRFFTDIDNSETLRAAMKKRDVHTVYVKVACSSSASCLAIYGNKDGREFIMTTIELADTGWYNSLKIRRYTSPSQIEEILAYLIAEGAQIEHAMPKARLNGSYFDCRVLVIGGQAPFVVVRQNKHPITNLHLGGWRGDAEALRREVSRDAYIAALNSCISAWRQHDCYQLGIDVMFEPTLERHYVLEANAFGDLLPGLGVYEWEIRERPRADNR